VIEKEIGGGKGAKLVTTKPRQQSFVKRGREECGASDAIAVLGGEGEGGDRGSLTEIQGGGWGPGKS